ncbi:hypothetical protein ACFFMN_22810, partial [Planobispora siamensis]
KKFAARYEQAREQGREQGRLSRRIAGVAADLARGVGMTAACERQGMMPGEMVALRRSDAAVEAQIQQALEQGRAAWGSPEAVSATQG